MITINAGCATLDPPIFGYIVDRTGSYTIAWQVLGAFLTVGIIGLITLLKDHAISEGLKVHMISMARAVEDLGGHRGWSSYLEVSNKKGATQGRGAFLRF